MRYTIYLALALVIYPGCATSRTHERLPLPADDAEAVGEEAGGGLSDDPVARWVRSQHHPIRTAGESRDDLEFLGPILEGKRIVQLGENGHGMREYNLLKTRLVRYLHEQLDYDVLVFESPLYHCYSADRMAPREEPATTMTACTFGVWHTTGVHALFEYLRSTHDTDDPLRLAGIDIQPIGWNKWGRPAFLRDVVGKIDAAYAEEVLRLDQTLLDAYDEGRDARRAFYRENLDELLDSYDELVTFLRDHEEELIRIFATTDQPEAPLVARQTAWSVAQYVRRDVERPHGSEYIEIRERAMAENLDFVLSELYPNKKVVVWGHNFHLRHDNAAIPPSEAYPGIRVRTMGSWTAERYRESLYTIGLYARSGRAANNSGRAYELAQPAPGSLEAILSATEADCLFVDFSRQAQKDETAWMFEPVVAHYNGKNPQSMVLRDQYDAVILVDTVSPREMFDF